MPNKRNWTWELSAGARKSIIFLAGLAGFMREVFIGGVSERPTIIIACLTAMGVPLVMNKDEQRNKEEVEEAEKTGKEK
jgi:hypothetical protein